MSKRNIQSNEPHVLIVGAGLAGIAAAVNLKKQLGFENFTIYEKSDGVGGVWKENTYPGCGSDVAAHWYSLSSELNPDWATYYSSQPDIRAYWESVWQRHNLDAHTVLNTEVVIAEWDDEVQVYHITLEDTRTGEQRVEDANVFWWAAGGFLAPFFPEDVPGVRDFHGDVWHSARWRHDVDLKGKRVAVIGNGCSAAQLVPKISEDPAVQVVNFVRSPQWYVPRHQYNYSPFTKWVFRHIPFAMKAYRASIYASAELGYFLAFYGEQSVTQKMARAQAEAYIKMKAPEKYLDFLVPKYPVGCKRVIVDPSYLESLNRPNVELNWTPIQSVVDDGLKLSTGEIVPFDVIIFGTGFSLLPPRLKIKGRGGLSMGEFFDRMGGPSAYKGITVPGFPNFYMLLGPNTAGGHASVVFNEEVQIDHALQLIKPVVEGKARSFEIRENVFTRYNNWIQERLARSVWAHCQSYYRLRSSDGRNVAIFPGCVTLFWWIVRKVNFSEYIGVGAERFQRERRIRRVNTIVGALLAAVLVAIGAGRSGWTLPSFALLAVPLGLKSA